MTIRTLMLCTLFAVSLPAFSAEKSAAAELQDLLAAMQVYSAQFSQTVFDDLGEEIQSSKGFAQVQRPGKLYWHSSEPFEAITVSKESILWHYDVDLEQVSRSTLSNDASEAPALILGGDVKALEEGFEISRIAQSQQAFLLTPRTGGGLFRKIEFYFDNTSILGAMYIIDSLQQKTEIRFSQAAVNGSIDEKLFDFVVPEGVDLIENGR